MNHVKSVFRANNYGRLRCFREDSRGSLIVITALLFPVLLAFLGLALDVGMIYDVKRRQQKAADAGATGGAHEVWRCNTDNVTDAAKDDTKRNGFDDGGLATTVAVTYPYTPGGGGGGGGGGLPGSQTTYGFGSGTSAAASGTMAAANGTTANAAGGGGGGGGGGTPVSGGGCASGSGIGDMVEVQIEETVPTYFARAFGTESVVVRSRAVAGLVAYGDGCIYVMNPTQQNAFKVAGGGELRSTCGVYINSNDDTTAGGSDGGSFVEVPDIGVGGGYNVSNNATVNAKIVQDMPYALDPMGYMEPPDYSSLPNHGLLKQTNMDPPLVAQPGIYENIDIQGGTVDFAPGLYVIEGKTTPGGAVQAGNFVINGGTVTTIGDGATFYMTAINASTSTQGNDWGSVSIAGNDTGSGGDVNLHAPSTDASGGIPGVLFFVDRRAYAHTHKIVGGSNSSFTGVIYMPSADLAIRGQSSVDSHWQLVVADTMEIVGTSNVTNTFGGYYPNLPLVRKVTLLE